MRPTNARKVGLCGPTTGQPFRFTGEQQDADVVRDPYYLRARYYDPALGRFWTRDPFPGDTERPQTINRYPYVFNNPVRWTDPTGWCHEGASHGIKLSDAFESFFTFGIKRPKKELCQAPTIDPAGIGGEPFLREAEQIRAYVLRAEKRLGPCLGPASAVGAGAAVAAGGTATAFAEIRAAIPYVASKGASPPPDVNRLERGIGQFGTGLGVAAAAAQSAARGCSELVGELF